MFVNNVIKKLKIKFSVHENVVDTIQDIILLGQHK